MIPGNNVAVNAARRDETSPKPDDSVLTRLVWKEKTDAAWPTAIVPDAFVQERFGCHTPVKRNDGVFTHPAALP